MTAIRKLLLVDDDPRDVELICHALRSCNLANEIDVANDGLDALDYLRRKGKFLTRVGSQPALVLLDVKMPKMSGLEVLREIRMDPSLNKIPVVMLTSSREQSDKIEGYHHGANAYVVKPIEFAEFVNAAQRIGVFWLLVNEPPNEN